MRRWSRLVGPAAAGLGRTRPVGVAACAAFRRVRGGDGAAARALSARLEAHDDTRQAGHRGRQPDRRRRRQDPPTVLAVVALLRRRGYAPGIVSRGYGRASDAVLEVQPGTAAADAGDEPLLLRLRSGVPVVVGRDRVAAGRELLRRHPSVDVVVSDDGPAASCAGPRGPGAGLRRARRRQRLAAAGGTTARGIAGDRPAAQPRALQRSAVDDAVAWTSGAAQPGRHRFAGPLVGRRCRVAGSAAGAARAPGPWPAAGLASPNGSSRCCALRASP